MNKLNQTITAFNSFSTGVMIPVLNLILLEKGSSLQTLPLLIGIYSFTVMVFELPSGIVADIYGRKRVYLLSCGFYFTAFTVLIAANNMVFLSAAIILYGLGRAFSSGSLDALFIDQEINQKGDGCITGVTSRIAVLEVVGLAMGCVIGGVLPDIAGTRSINILVRIILIIVLFLLCLLFVKEEQSNNEKVHSSITEHLRQGRQLVFSEYQIGMIFTGVFFTGFMLSVVETYWQSAFIQITRIENSSWMIGLITFIGFAVVAIGNVAVKKLLNKYNNRWLYIYKINRIILAFFIVILSMQKSPSGFTAIYSISYLVLGASNMAENSIINKGTPNHMRASIFSLNSLISQIGGLCASLFSSIMIFKLKVSGIWFVAGVLIFIHIITSTAAISIFKNKNSEFKNSMLK